MVKIRMEFDRSKYPALPGVYLMKDSSGTVIYVGKATSLKDRLSQYFRSNNSTKTRMLVSNISSIDFILAKDANEALILESNLIKTNQPKYNMVLKDAKHYSYLAITNEQFPRLLVARKNSKGKFRVRASKFFGPFVDGSKRAISARYLRKLFKVRICTTLPKKECLQYHLGNCDAPCINKISTEDYQKNIDSLCSVLSGKTAAKQIIESLTLRMKDASQKQDFEAAVQLRDQISSLSIFFERQNVEKIRTNDDDFIWFETLGDSLHIQIIKTRNGVIVKTEKHTEIINAQEEPELLFCTQYYPNSDSLPDRIYSNLSPDQMESLNQFYGSKVFFTPTKDKNQLVKMASNSLAHLTIDHSVIELQKQLSLPNSPITIETFDISTLFGENTVSSMVQFVNGSPNKSGYRKFIIKTVIGQDDFSSMKETVLRRYSRLKKEGSPMPDLIVIDGGPGQLHSAISALMELGLEIPICSLAKKEEEIFLPNKMHSIRLPKTNLGLKLLQRGRDEAHRFAITFHKKRRSKSTFVKL